MASDFYRRTRDLFEEFKNRERQYLNSERAARSHFQIIDETSMPVKEYLVNLNKREKEMEDAYLGLMRHMEQLDNRTESITGKLRKLESLRMCMSSTAPVLHNSTNTYDHNYTSSSNAFKTDNALSDTFSHSNHFVLSKQKVVQYASTQTDLKPCENCQFPITLSSKRPQGSSFLNNSLNTIVPPFENTSLSSQIVENESASETTIPFHDDIYDETTLNFNEVEKLEKPSMITQSLPKITEETPIQDETSLDQTISANTSLPMPPNTKPLENKISPSTTVVSTNSDIQLRADLPSAMINKEDVADEILNRKIDILNSSTKKSDSNLHSSVVSEVFEQLEMNKDSDLTKSGAVDNLSTLSVNQNVSQVLSEGEISISKPNVRKSALSQDGLSDKRSESPISIGGAPSPSLHSENISAVSDSDSFGEKGHLKESAAYQTMIGNTIVAKKIQKVATYSESESEDEVERALANATRKASSVPASTNVQEKLDDSRKNETVELKVKNEPRKSISLAKSQELSKNTRKVLGIDTSSGSEGEIQIPAKPSQKIEEDSDEFDFYD